MTGHPFAVFGPAHLRPLDYVPRSLGCEMTRINPRFRDFRALASRCALL